METLRKKIIRGQRDAATDVHLLPYIRTAEGKFTPLQPPSPPPLFTSSSTEETNLTQDDRTDNIKCFLSPVSREPPGGSAIPGPYTGSAQFGSLGRGAPFPIMEGCFPALPQILG